jgi:hypothetical protein
LKVVGLSGTARKIQSQRSWIRFVFSSPAKLGSSCAWGCVLVYFGWSYSCVAPYQKETTDLAL